MRTCDIEGCTNGFDHPGLCSVEVEKLQADLEKALAERDAARRERDDLLAEMFRFTRELGAAVSGSSERKS